MAGLPAERVGHGGGGSRVRVSMVVPCFNPGSFIAETIESLRSQTQPPDEVFVVDDCSTDGVTRSVLAELASDPLVTVIRLDENSGPGAARNAGVDRATGEFIGFVDADDLLSPDALERMTSALEGDETAGFSYLNVASFGNTEHRQDAPPFNAYLLHVVNFCSSAAMFRKSVFDEGLRFTEDRRLVTEDWDMFLSAVAHGYRGVPANASLFYRRYGYSRIDGSDTADGEAHDLGAEQRRRRPEIFAPNRLLRLKQAEAPAVSLILGSDDASSLKGCTAAELGDLEVVAHGGRAKGKVVMAFRTPPRSAAEAGALAERAAAAFEWHPTPAVVVFVREDVCRREPFVPLRESDVRGGWIDPRDICGVAVRSPLLADSLFDPEDQASAEDVFMSAAMLGSSQPREVIALVGPQQGPARAAWRDLAAWTPHAPLQLETLRASAAPGVRWEREARWGCPTGLAWRSAGTGDRLFPAAKRRSRLIVAAAVRDIRRPEAFLVAEEERVPEGCVVVRERCVSLLSTEARGTVPVVRVVDPTTGERRTTVGPSGEFPVEAVVGHAETRPVPGAVSLPEILGDPNLSGAWAYPAALVPDLTRVDRVRVGEWGLWRGRNRFTGRHVYGRIEHLRRDDSLEIEGPVCLVNGGSAPDALRYRTVFWVGSGGRESASGIAVLGWPGCPPPLRLGAPAGHLAAAPEHHGLRPIYVAVHRATGDILVSNIENEGKKDGFTDHRLLGFAHGL